MLIGQTTAPPAAAPAPPPSAWARVKGYAGQAAEIYDAPVDDLAAVIGVNTIWLAGLLVSLKFLTSGLWMMTHPRGCPVPRRP